MTAMKSLVQPVRYWPDPAGFAGQPGPDPAAFGLPAVQSPGPVTAARTPADPYRRVKIDLPCRRALTRLLGDRHGCAATSREADSSQVAVSCGDRLVAS